MTDIRSTKTPPEDFVKAAVTEPSHRQNSLVCDVMNDALLGRAVEIFSVNGIRYRGVITAIRDSGTMGELFELGSNDDPKYHRLVYVMDRLVQIRYIPAE